MAKAKTDLVIVESPAKAKTIEKYLGGSYRVTASMGHLRDLPKSTLGVDVDNGFEPIYQPLKGREDIIADLRKAAKASSIVYLATDPDREGEAISWHLKELLELSDDKARRVTFNEITKKVVLESIQNPRDIDQNLVDAQQARRILDRILGYKLSPLLWRKVRRGLSAGRVQSVATRMVVDREEEIRAFIPEEYWHLDAVLERRAAPGAFTARFYGVNGKKTELHTGDAVDAVVSAVTGGVGAEKQELSDSKVRLLYAATETEGSEKTGPGEGFKITHVKKSEKKTSPPPPFITSTLQQEASRRLGMTPRRTMAIAQQLYEGVEITGEGAVGLITYMRTDSLRISEEAMSAARVFIESYYGKEYYHGAPRRFKAGRSSQDAHEAIRPSSIELTPDKIKKDLTNDQFRLYRLIWSRFAACQMANAVYDAITIDAECAGYTFRANHQELRFPGFTAVYIEGKDEEETERTSPLPDLVEGEMADIRYIDKEQKFTLPPPRYTEATLVRAMEEKGIGRPSTYAPTISTIMTREYVIKEGRTLRPTILGEVITGLMKERFPEVVDLKFTARMEEELDSVEDGQRAWKSVLEGFYGDFDRELTEAEQALDGERIKIPDEVSDEICDVCGKNLVVKSGKFGRFLACPGYPECSFTKPIVVEMPGKCPKCGNRILKRTSKKGYTFYGCEKGAECGFMTWDVPVADNCPECGKTMFKKSGRGANKPFCTNDACPNFLPEDRRGYKRKTDSTAAKTDDPGSEKMTADSEKPIGKTKKAAVNNPKKRTRKAAK